MSTAAALKGPKLLLVCSPGGHLQDLLSLEAAWSDFDRSWVTTPAPDVEQVLRGERYDLGHGPTNRNVIKLLRNFVIAFKVLRNRKPDVILSTGAAIAIPFFVLGKLSRRRLVYVECLARVDSLSTSGRAVYWFADSFFVQWPKLARYRRARYEGSVL
ncbi:MAG: PssD/Cps14F family polysaccharide biosynthesis glycosyltransferase [Actinomycetota bacterium]